MRRLIAITAMAVSCLVPPTAVASKPRRQTASSVEAAGQATASLGLDLLRAAPRGNLVVAPDSLETALAMAGEGARSTTASQISHVAHLGSRLSFGVIGRLQAQIEAERSAAAGGDPKAPKLAIANGLFVQEGFTVETPFLAALRGQFGAAPQRVDFESDAAAKINAWIKQHTEGVIPSLLEATPAYERLALASAVYLKARWANEFTEPATNEPFHGTSGVKTVPFLKAIQRLPYAAGTGYRAVELPYKSSTLSLLVVLPTGQSLPNFQRRLTPQSLGAIVRRLRPEYVELSLPEFHIATDQRLSSLLSRLGMPLAFGRQADFSGISTSEPLHIGEAVQAADIRADQSGTTAAAVTVVTLEALGPKGPLSGVPFDADHPFLYFLLDERTGAVLFAGRLQDAAAAQS